MGCVSTKPYVTEDDIRRPLERTQSKRLSRASSCREGNPPLMNRSDSRSLLIDRQTNRSIRLNEDNFEKTRVKPDDDALANFSSIRMIPKGQEAELVAAGWPSWLASAAGEAISGWIPRRSDSFERLDKIGEGTYSSVYRARDLIRGNIVALKRVRFDNLDRESVKFMAREILILRRLDHPNIIKLDGLITSNTSTSLYLIFEYMEHDLTGLSSLPGLQFTEPQVKCFMQQLLSGLDHCHSRGVLHRDIKGSNLLINESGILKIADFGLATFFDPQKSLPLTSRVVTLWYRPPELLLGATHYGVAVDLWSAGCILGELYTGKPIMPGRTEVEQLHKIFKLCGSPPDEYWKNSKFLHSTAFKPQRPYPRRLAERFQELSTPALALVETLLSVDPASRGTASSALNSEFFTTEPFACDPSTLPEYPPSKEIDARKREEETKRHQALENKRDRVDQIKQGSQESAASLSAKVNAEFVSSLQKKKSQSQAKPRQELFRPCRHDSTLGPIFDLSRNTQDVKEVSKEIFDRLHQRGIYSGPLTGGKGWSNADEKRLDSSSFSRLPNLTTLSSLAPNRTLASGDNSGSHGSLQNKKATDATGRFPVTTSDLDRIRNDNLLHSDYPQYEENTCTRRSALLCTK
ncbi:putative serine/threonine-protein kinase At1g54610 isoform X2 [Silene latifolia]|uniref:putative serine/threonine-protein kinase At1g54610 isoform X2 n=1 Tax=Silene latifolia TaxID=37657 RepID=UPI003D789D7A